MFSRSRPNVDAPAWFTRALAHKPDRTHVDVDGCRIHLRVWGSAENPPLVLVHGGGAHSGWWDHIAPFFAATHRVIAPDLSGHGDSGTRTRYSLRLWAQEIMAAAQAVSSGHPTIVGHSLGGWVTASAATHYGDSINSIVVVDSPLRDRAPEERMLRGRNTSPRGYRSRDAILSRFRAVPAQEEMLPFVAAHIAEESVRRTLRGWVWKFDPAIFAGHILERPPAEQEMMEELMNQMPCRVGYLRCENGLVPPDMAERIRDILQLRGPFVELAEAGHHPMLDQPLPLVATLRTLLEFWSIT
ncbi:alpha/beta hydrolase fold family protein [Mycolicibacterium hassiacum DSM 44199]|jgi:pimeloyl-ACP methyl ester carboxylesterase|uniref:Alpha/beta hydrolase fold family protein n=1 Tax=Mycolicibacterium hassiacum (strain DSM 44199 / CIP 105218 / JCM 12690 / 3849) TaxID=1122247 RepID=K5BHQ1_MYCHD|nr:alpha/beta hydrolase [Mycolicibacterium hassiacum]EKF25877.1 alpha/beta hydrolase fold family protein [Mycolicibacterium hassiacum DSM 44199]MBX5488150.1 alpha/beta hydrolase [Mycolicibacterium hassiacum]MDA4088330.1 alpha/beta hydrolase [Mycolicibacterium hassiacum DSM 44199]PZN21089.1 MAG: alpha/beta hydrolase [Mycolicibacterium hassiacum]VCT92417.1 Haloacetate dehalogenase H-1 [Mycolicibacterium hassiacum DSM 44199]